MVDPDLRRHLDAVVARVVAIEQHIRDAPPHSRSAVATQPHDMGAALDHERRLNALEKESADAEERAREDRTHVVELRVTLAGISANMEHLLEQRRRRGGGA